MGRPHKMSPNRGVLSVLFISIIFYLFIYLFIWLFSNVLDPIGLCPFPNNFQGNQRWWRGYVGPASSDYKYDVFGSSFIKEYRQSIKNTPTSESFTI